MTCHHKSPMMPLLMLMMLLLLINLGSGSQTQQNVPSNSNLCPFHVSCSHNKKFLELPAVPVPLKLLISKIDYKSQHIVAHDPDNCLPRILLTLNFQSIFPFRLFDNEYFTANPTNITFFDCSSTGQRYLRISRQDMFSCPIYAIASDESFVSFDLASCIKLLDRVLPLSAYQIRGNILDMAWSENLFDTRCLKCGVAGSAVLVFLLGAIIRIYRYYKMKGEDHARVEIFLKDYKALKPTRFSYADIKRITHQFKEKLGEGAHGAVYKGKLSTQILVAVKILNNSEGDDGTEFINEVGTMGKIHHVNVVRLLGFCADGFHRALVYDFFPNGSLQNFIISASNNKDKKTFLGWEKLQEIALGIATGIDYLHQGCDQRILHFDINPHNVLLDDTLTPKITDFGLAKLCSKNRSTVSMTAARGTLGYMAPEVFSRNFGNVSYKSDIYSYGMLLLEMVGGRKNIVNNTTGQENDSVQVLYPDWIHGLLEGKDMHVPIDDEEGDCGIAKKLAIVGLWCIQWHPMHRPSMKTVMQMLHGEGDKLKVPTNPFQPKASTSTSTSSTIVAAKRLNLELEVIQELD
ncbi:rust resistance kinase Lr10-like isoform X2 [Lotus japonicus]|uniref:rust resistance kinase Lr10-like isoform X2 n=1 Tax=Lotus japonicus TaxID=34305 RepID=UPI00258EF21D|nr:rust resistance kinase Lr10-like isoform X2 [Lotus japonicus]